MLLSFTLLYQSSFCIPFHGQRGRFLPIEIKYGPLQNSLHIMSLVQGNRPTSGPSSEYSWFTKPLSLLHSGLKLVVQAY